MPGLCAGTFQGQQLMNEVRRAGHPGAQAGRHVALNRLHPGIGVKCSAKAMPRRAIYRQKFAFKETRNERDSIGWKWMSSTPAAASPGRRET